MSSLAYAKGAIESVGQKKWCYDLVALATLEILSIWRGIQPSLKRRGVIQILCLGYIMPPRPEFLNTTRSFGNATRFTGF